MATQSPLRRRQFSEIRTGYRSQHSISAYQRTETQQSRQIHKSPSRYIRQQNTPVKKVHYKELYSTGIKTPTRSPVKLVEKLQGIKNQEKQFQKTLSRNNTVHKQTIYKSSQKLKHLQYCIDCTNQYLSEKKKKHQRAQQRKQQQYVHKCNEINNTNRINWTKNEEAKRNAEYQIQLQQNMNIIAQKEANKKKQLRNKIQQQKRRNRQYMQQQKLRRKLSEAQFYKQAKFQRQLKEQIKEDHYRKKKQQQNEKMWKPSITDISIQIQKQQYNTLRNKAYQKDLLIQIQERQDKRIMQKQIEKRIDQTNNRLIRQYTTNTFEEEAEKNKNYKNDLKQQMRQKSFQKMTAKNKQIKQDKQLYRQMKFDSQMQARIDAQINATKVHQYIGNLKNQIYNNQVKKTRQKQLDRAPGYIQIQQPPKDLGQQCDKCHKNYPTKYMSLIEPA